MKLLIDAGNTKIKSAVYYQGEEIISSTSSELASNHLDDIFTYFPKISRAIISSVRPVNEHVVEQLKQRVPTIELCHSTPLPVKVLYKTPNTIGTDRLAAASGACKLFPDTDLLIADIGTAITIDYVNSSGELIGGNISPGMMLRFKALNNLTANLPLECPNSDVSHIGQTTSEAIQAGVQNSIKYELEGYISSFLKNTPNGKVVVTGGDAKFFAKTIKSPIFVVCNLGMVGLHTILEHNVKNS